MKLGIMIILAFSMLSLAIAQDSQPSQSNMPAGMTGGYETVQSEVLKVYSAEDQGARYRAYVVKWRDQEIVVSDQLGSTDKKVGDNITFMAHRIEMPEEDKTLKILQFMIMEFPELTTDN
jgi:hypothetical protein